MLAINKPQYPQLWVIPIVEEADKRGETNLKTNGNTFHEMFMFSTAIDPPLNTNEPRFEKTCLRDFPPGPTQIKLYSHRRRLAA